jgi:flagellar biosynthesis GTPase FlhF
MADPTSSSAFAPPRTRAARSALAALALLLSSSAQAEGDASHDAAEKAKAKAQARAEMAAEAKKNAALQAKEAKQKAKEQDKAKAKALEVAKAKAVAKAKLKAMAAKQKKKKSGDDEDVDETKLLPLLITYDPATIGIGGTCPGDNDISRGECALIIKDYQVAYDDFMEAWNSSRSPFAAMRLGDLAWLEGAAETAVQWYEQVNGSTMMLRMANLRRCELEPGCGVTGRNVPAAETFSGPFGDEALLRTARIYTRSGFPELAAAILVDGNGRGCNLAPETCGSIAAAALEKSTTTSTLALSLSLRQQDDAQDEARSIAARQLGFDYLASDLEVVARGEVPAHRVTPAEEAAAEAKILRAAAKAAAAKEAAAAAAAEKAAAEAKQREAEKVAAEAKSGGEGNDEAAKKLAAEAAKKATEEAAKKAAETATKVDEAARKVADAAGEEDAEGNEGEKKLTPQQEKAAKKKQEFARRTRRDKIDDGVKSAEDSLEKTRRLLEMAGGALPLGGPK